MTVRVYEHPGLPEALWIDACPRPALTDARVSDLLTSYIRSVRHHALPAEGGIDDQPAAIMDAYDVIARAVALPRPTAPFEAPRGGGR